VDGPFRCRISLLIPAFSIDNLDLDLRRTLASSLLECGPR